MTARGSSEVRGVWAAALTPLLDDGRVDGPGLIRHIGWLLDNGCDGAVLFGTTGEAASFTLDERQAALETVVAGGIAPDKLIVGTGCCALADTVRLTRHGVDAGCAGALILPPFYVKGVADDGVYGSYAHVIDQVGEAGLRVYLYHFPDMSGVPISFPVIERLLYAFPDQVAGIKDSSGDLDNMTGMARLFDGFDVFAGDDHLLWPLLMAGGVGSITATANIAPHLLATVYREWRQDSARARAAQAMLKAVWQDLLLHYPVTEALKEYLAHETCTQAWLAMRLPLVRIGEDRRRDFLGRIAATGFRLLDSQKEVL